MQRWLLQQGWRGESGPRDVQTSALDAWARRVLERGHRRIGRGARAFAALDSAQRHRLRIALKRQRYAAEFFAQLFPGRAHARYLDVLRRAQESLGQANDAGMARRLLDTDARPELAFAADGLLKYERKAAQAAGRHLDAFLALQPHW
jgi:CHAD domain-containing protein